MSDIAIRAEGLGKQYQIGTRRAAYRTLREAIHVAAAGAVRIGRQLTQRNGRREPTHHTFWALKDVSFQVKRGEVIGIVGRNGAGKSTLLKLLSRITEPTEGYADVAGTVGSLLEVGTGFHPELSGRENIYLNGTILGMKRQEIKRKFDAIVEFAEVAQFIDTPVKRYSSGMYLRLAFAVAAYLEPEILLVDEVLAVGDAAFRKKCLGKMNSVAKQGRTVLFVSHDMTAVSMLCRTAVLLEGGQVERAGRADEVVNFYLEKVSGAESAVTWDTDETPSDDAVRLLGVAAGREDGTPAGTFSISDSVHLMLDFELRPPASRINPVFVVNTLTGMTLFSTANYDEPHWGSAISDPGRYRATCRIPANLFDAGTYLVDVMVVEETRFVRASTDSAVSFQIHDDGSGRGDYVGEWRGVIRPRCIWSTGRA